MPDKVARDVSDTIAGLACNLMIDRDDSRPDIVAGAVNGYASEQEPGGTGLQIGWMVRPEYQPSERQVQ